MSEDRYCAAPFRHIQYTPQGVQPCCNWRHESGGWQIPPDHPDPFNHDLMVELRALMLSGKGHPGCSQCYHTESNGGHSMRQGFNGEHGRAVDAKLSYLEFNLGNLCNLRCRMCNSWSSSKWIADEIELGIISHPVMRRDADDIRVDISGIDRIRFIGGEPLLEQDAISEVLRRLVDREQGLSGLSVNITTNGTTRIRPELLHMLSMCGSVDLLISVDAIGKRLEYQRSDSSWDEIRDNLSWFSDACGPVFNLYLHPVWTLINVGGATELFTHMVSKLPKFKLMSSLLFYPRYLSIRNLPPQLKLRYSSMLSKHENDARGIAHACRQICAEMVLDPVVPLAEVRRRLLDMERLRRDDLSLVDRELYDAIVDQSVESPA